MFVSKDRKTQKRMNANRKKRSLKSRPRLEGGSPSLARAIAGVMGVDMEMLGLAGRVQNREQGPVEVPPAKPEAVSSPRPAPPVDAPGSGKTPTEDQPTPGDV